MSNNYMVELRAAIRHAESSGDWVVLLCSAADLSNCGKLLATLLPGGNAFSGRTALLPGGGKISITRAEEDVFVPEHNDFVLGLLVGCDSKGMQKWQKRASSLLQVNA